MDADQPIQSQAWEKVVMSTRKILGEAFRFGVLVAVFAAAVEIMDHGIKDPARIASRTATDVAVHAVGVVALAAVIVATVLLYRRLSASGVLTPVLVAILLISAYTVWRYS